MVTLCFRPASELPDDDTSVLCAGEECVWVGYHRGGMWYDVSGNEWPGVRAWADLPDAGECLSAYLSLKDLAKYASFHTNTLRSFMNQGMPFYRIGKSIRVRRSEVE